MDLTFVKIRCISPIFTPRVRDSDDWDAPGRLRHFRCAWDWYPQPEAGCRDQVPRAQLVLPTVLLCLHRAREGNGTREIPATSAVFTIAVVWGMPGC